MEAGDSSVEGLFHIAKGPVWTPRAPPKKTRKAGKEEEAGGKGGREEEGKGRKEGRRKENRLV